MIALDLLAALAAAPVLAAALYLALLALAARRPAAWEGSDRWTFAVVVPAHDEEALVARTVTSLLQQDYPPHRFRVVVVADNCRDRTAERARAAGAQVLERADPAHRGKGPALAFAFAHLLREGWADAVVVVDADTVADGNLLRAFAARLDRGAPAIQADYGVRNLHASWRTRLMELAFALFNRTRSLGRERLGLSCGLRGNGMCFRAELLARVPHRAESVVEDVEYGLDLGEAGVRVCFAGEARVLGEMPASGRAAGPQRQRWEQGRRRLARARARGLLARGLARRDPRLVDLALDLIVPPLTRLAGATLAGLAVSAALAARGGALAGLLAWGASAALLAAYALRGWQLSGTGARGLAALLAFPAYAAWKLSLALRSGRTAEAEWIRTERDKEVA